jgi:hypothetical protein
MSGYRDPSKLTHSGDGEWVDFPASPDPDPWGALLRQANSLSAGRLVEHAHVEHAHVEHAHVGHAMNVGHVGGAVVTSVAIVLRGLLVMCATVATVAYLLLTNSHL